MGYSDVPWFKLTWYILWIYTGLTLLIMLGRADFVNMTICTTALYMMFNTQRITRDVFRVLVAAIILSLIYDLIWFFLKHGEFSSENKAEGGMEDNLRRFVLMLSYISFILRVRVRLFMFVFLDFGSDHFLERQHGLWQNNLKQRTSPSFKCCISGEKARSQKPEYEGCVLASNQ